MRAYVHSLIHRRRVLLFAACMLLLALSSNWLTVPAAPLAGPGGNDRYVAMAVAGLVADKHVTRSNLDDEISQRAMQHFLDSFDPRKMYFEQTDVDEFMRRRNLLDNEVTNGNIEFAHAVFGRFLQRLDQRVALVHELLQGPFDFSSDDQLVTDPDVLQYPRTPQEVRDRWVKFLKYNLLSQRAGNTEDAEAKRKIGKRFDSLAMRWRQTDSDELLERYLTAVTTSFDPHTTYMSPSSLENFRILMRLNLEGIGAAIQVDDDGATKVTKVIPGGAADKHGKLKPEDRIVSVGQGEHGEMVDVVDMKLNDVVQLIRGPAGSVVRLGVQSATESETMIYNITRAKVELEDSAARSVILERPDQDGRTVKIGVIDLPSFYMDMEAARDEGTQGEFRSTTSGSTPRF